MALDTPAPVIIVSNKFDGLSVRKLSSEELNKNWTFLESIPPHRELNPMGHKFQYEGVELKYLLEKDLNPDVEHVSIIGLDGYIVTIPVTLIFNFQSLLAFRENGQFISGRRGGQQIVYKTDDLPAQFSKKAAFWCWYVRGFVVGDLPNQLYSVSGGGQKQFIDMTSFQGNQQTGHTPPSSYSYPPRKCESPVSIPLDEVKKRIKSSRLIFSSLTGEILEIGTLNNDNITAYELLASQNSHAIPPSCGGPFILRKKTLNKRGSNFFVSKTGIYKMEIQ